MRENKTETYAKNIVNRFRDSADIVDFVESCMQEASWLGRFSGKNRFMFQDAIKRRLRSEGLDKLIKKLGGHNVHSRKDF